MRKLFTLFIILGLTLFQANVKAQRSDTYLGQIIWVPLSYAPKGFIECNGQLVAIAQFSALFSLLGTQFGGNGQTTFALPDMRGRTMLSSKGQSGIVSGHENIELEVKHLPSHNHNLKAVKVLGDTNNPAGNMLADTSVGDNEYASGVAGNVVTLSSTALQSAGSNSPHNNMQPYAVLKCLIAVQGIYPPRP